MARRRERKGLADDVMEITAKLPWWVGVVLAVVSYLVLHSVAGQPVATATSTQDVGRIAGQQLFKTLASIGQFILPLAFLAGALVSFVAQQKRTKLVTDVATSPSPASLNAMT